MSVCLGGGRALVGGRKPGNWPWRVGGSHWTKLLGFLGAYSSGVVVKDLGVGVTKNEKGASLLDYKLKISGHL